MLYKTLVMNHFKQRPTGFSPLYVRSLLLCLMVFAGSNGLFSQYKRMVAIGSSTTAGYITSSPDSSWVGRFSRYYKCQTGVADACLNLGVAGANVYAGMPTTYNPPADRQGSDRTTNVSRAVALLQTLTNAADGVIIVNYPTNEYTTFSIAEVMNCLQVIYDSAISAGNRCYITTTQPRNDAAFNNSAMKKKLADIKDSIIARFGVAHTLNFWDGMFNPADTTVLPIYSAGDQIHFNDAGHRVLFQRLVAKNVFRLPVWYAAPTGYLNVLTSWGSNTDGSGSHPVSFMGDDQTFIIANNPSPSINADWTISGKGVELILGDGVKRVVFNIPTHYKITVTSPFSDPDVDCH